MMGYRQMDSTINPSIWAKPFAKFIVRIDLDNKKIGSYFYGRSTVTDLLCWASASIDEENISEQIEDFESYNCPAGSTGKLSFPFLDRQQLAEELLDPN